MARTQPLTRVVVSAVLRSRSRLIHGRFAPPFYITLKSSPPPPPGQHHPLYGKTTAYSPVDGHSPSNSFELASRRRAAGGLRAGEYEQYDLPSFQPEQESQSPPLAGRQFRRQRGAVCLRPRAVGTLVIIALLTLVLLPASNRKGVHSALTSVGVPLPDALPDRLHDFMDYWNVGVDDGSGDLEYIPPPPVTDDAPIDDTSSPYVFHPNGHLLVDPLASYPTAPSPHPIITLIKRAEAVWNHKVARQSKTLKEAAAEYRRRYTRNPPKGFEEWWAYAQANRIVLTDEYDQIHRDLEPFWALCVTFGLVVHRGPAAHAEVRAGSRRT